MTLSRILANTGEYQGKFTILCMYVYILYPEHKTVFIFTRNPENRLKVEQEFSYHEVEKKKDLK
jgi:hypothetical protein